MQEILRGRNSCVALRGTFGFILLNGLVLFLKDIQALFHHLLVGE